MHGGGKKCWLGGDDDLLRKHANIRGRWKNGGKGEILTVLGGKIKFSEEGGVSKISYFGQYTSG